MIPCVTIFNIFSLGRYTRPLAVSFWLLAFGFQLSILPAHGQISPEKLTSGRMDRGQWIKAEKSLRKSLSKDTLNAEARYLLSLYYFSFISPSQNLDSALGYIKGASKDFQKTPARDRERLKRVPLDSLLILRLAKKIDSAAFEKAKGFNTEAAYQYFIDLHTSASQRGAVIELRDEVGFLDALKVNTWFSFQNFITRHPASHRKAEAQRRFDKLLFEDKTRSQRLSSYIQFNEQFPESPYRSLAEKNIFEISTASGSPESFHWFIQNHPSSVWSARAKNILYMMQSAEQENIFENSWMSDSLKQVEQLNDSYWVPVFKSGLYGFMNDLGTEVIAPRFEKVSDDYRCGDVKDPLLITSQGLIGRNGAMVWKGPISDLKDIGIGFVLVSTDSGGQVIHTSGFPVGQNVQGAQGLCNRFVSLEHNKKWAVFTLSGRQLLPFSLDAVMALDSLVVLTRGSKKILTTPMRLGRMADHMELKEDFVFDDVRRWGNQNYWVRNGTLEGVIDGRLNFVIPLDRQVLRKTSFGFLGGKAGKVFMAGIRRLENTSYKNVQEQAGWIRLQTEKDRYLLYDVGLDRLTEGDSVWFQGQLAFQQTHDSLHVFLPSGQKLTFIDRASFQIKEFRDSTTWLVLDEKKKKVVFDAASGIKLFSIEADQLEPVSPNIFVVTKANKKGLVSEEGKLLVPIEFDAIVAGDQGTYSLLKDKKFGWYDERTKLLIKPTFDRNVKMYHRGLWIAFKDKGYGFIPSDGKPKGNFEWEEIQYWTDSVAWVKRNFQWILWDIHGQKAKLSNVRSFTVVKDTEAEKIFIIRQENAFGVISSRRGTVVPIQYSDIVNLGTSEIPLYFTERHIEEAAISVVVYYDQHGKIIRKQAMEAEEFEKIYCDN